MLSGYLVLNDLGHGGFCFCPGSISVFFCINITFIVELFVNILVLFWILFECDMGVCILFLMMCTQVNRMESREYHLHLPFLLENEYGELHPICP